MPQRYRSKELIMPPKTEIVEHDRMAAAVKQCLIAYYQNVKAKPTKIIYYRDGVSDGQFAEVMMRELCAIQSACRALEATYEPMITFIVVQKRHHTRLFKKELANPTSQLRMKPAAVGCDCGLQN